MNEFDVIIDFGSKNLKLGVFNKDSENIYSSKQEIKSIEYFSLDKSLTTLIKDAEKYLSSHIGNVIVLYDSTQYYSLDLCIKKVFDQEVDLTKVYNYLIEDAHFFVSQNNFKDQIIHLVINNIVVNENIKIDKISKNKNIKSLILEIKFICLSKTLIKEITNQFKKNNLQILNLYCSSYVKSFSYKNKIYNKDHTIFLDIGFERTSCLVFNDNQFEYFKTVPIGSNDITKDISKVLKLNLEYAENIKIEFNKEITEISFNKVEKNQINPYSEILKKNFSIDLLKKIINARVDEIIEMVIFDSNYMKNLNSKFKLATTGGGSRLFSYNETLIKKKMVHELFILSETDLNTCEAGIKFHKSDENFHNKFKKKVKKPGFFESFFKLFSK